VSVWNRIGDLASSAGKGVFNSANWLGERAVSFGGDIVGMAGAPAKFAWDLGTAPWNDDEEYNGFVQSFKTAATGAGASVVKPLASAGGAVMKVPGVAPALETLYKVNQEAIREPLTTYFLVRGEVAGGNILGFFDPDTWEKAYKGAQEISLGQAFVGQFRSAYDPEFNIYDPREREAAFKKSAWGRSLSGGVDVFAQLFGDVSLVGGKAAKVLKASELGVGKLNNADAVAKAAEEITKAQYGVNNRFTKILKDFTDNNSAYAISHPMVKSSSNPGLLAHLLGDSVDVDETALILRSALGDPKALNNLRAQRVHISDALEAERGKLSAVDEFKLFAAPDGSGMLPFLNDSPAVTEEALNNYRSLASTDKYFADLMEVGKGGGALTRTTGLGLQGVEDFVAKSRATKFYDKKVGNARIDIYQPTPFHVLYQKFSWSQKERPAGWVDFNDPDSYREVIATVNRLEKKANLTPVESKKLLDEYLAASTPEAKFTATLNLEGTGLRALAKKYDVDEEFATDLYNNYKRARTSALKSIKDKGFMVDNDASVIRVPQLESQTANFLPLMDFDVMDDLLKRNASTFKLIGTTKNRVFNSLDFVQDAFKAAVLLRLGYTIRNTVDSSLRIASSVGAYAQLRHLGPGLKHIITDKVATPSRLIDRYRAVDAGMTFAQVQKSANKVTNELNDIKTRISATEAKASLNPDDLDLAGELNTLKLLQEEKQAVYQHYADVLNRSPKAQPKQSIGTGSYRVTTSDGQVYDLDDALGGPLGDMFKRIASSGNSFERMVDSNTDLYKRNLESKGIGAVKPTDPAYFEQWAQTLRTQFGNSAVVNKIVAGETVDDITRWLKSSVDGRDLRRRLAINSDNAAEYVTRISGFLDNYLPVSSNLRDKIKTVTAEDLRSTFKDPTTLPIIHGHILKENFNNVSEIQKKGVINSLFKLLATMPEDAFARNPLFVHLYRQEAKRRVDIMSGLKDDIISLDEQRVIMDQSRKAALREMKGILFNIERKTNLATAMKYINPFFSAQENAYKTWMKLAVADPSLINRGYLVWQAPNRSGLVTDENGEQVPVGKTSGSDTIWLDLPKGITKISGLESLTKMGISKGSLDIIFQGGLDALYNQGNPNIVADIFPVGPYVGVTVSALTKNQPTVQESIKGMFPYGIPKDLQSAFLPPWLQRQITANAELEDPQFARTYQLIWKTEQQNAKRDGRPAVKPEKIMDMTKDYWTMRTFASLIMPFAPRFDSPYQYYLNKSREYKRIYGLDADAKFLQDYPEYFSFSASLSKNPTGVQSSTVAAENTKKYSGLISELSNINPRLIGLVTNDPTGYDFSQAAYNFLFRKKVSPGSPDKFLSSLSPQESQRQNDAEKGWIQYNKLSDAIDNELQKRGLSSTQQKGAEDLKFIKQSFITKLAIQTDADGKPVFNNTTGQYEQTAWYDDYLDSDGSKTNKVIVGLGKILEDQTFMKDNKNNPTWKSVSAYLDIRKAISRELLRRDVKSIDAKANVDLKFIYDGMVNKLKQDDKLGFAYLYDRFLSQDLITDKYLTPKVSE
jgi:5'-deoxynucleotidase YfbR-like HD superfamily hydrolase